MTDNDSSVNVRLALPHLRLPSLTGPLQIKAYKGMVLKTDSYTYYVSKKRNDPDV